MNNTINFDTGIEEFIVNGNSKIRVNFKDPNLYYRFVSIRDELLKMEAEFVEETKDFDDTVDEYGFPVKACNDLTAMKNIDSKMKRKLEEIFELDNNFDEIFSGINVMAFDKKGNRIIFNFLSAIAPKMEKAMETTETAVDELVGNREQRRAKNKAKNNV